MELKEGLSLPPCHNCETGIMVPLSDYGREGAPIRYKAWVCTNPACGYHLRIDNGEISAGSKVPKSSK